MLSGEAEPSQIQMKERREEKKKARYKKGLKFEGDEERNEANPNNTKEKKKTIRE